MTKRAKAFAADAAYTVALVAVILAAWAIASAALGNPFVLPGIAETLEALGEVFVSENFLSGLAGTLTRCALSYAISVALAFLFFCLSMCFPRFARVFGLVVSALRTLPTVAVALILALMVGGYAAPVVIATLVIMPILYSAARGAVASAPRELAEICRLNGAGRVQTLFAVWLPAVASAAPDSLSSALSYNVKTVIGAEILVQSAASLGMLMSLAKAYLMTATLIAMTIFAVVLSVVLETAVRAALSVALRRYSD